MVAAKSQRHGGGGLWDTEVDHWPSVGASMLNNIRKRHCQQELPAKGQSKQRLGELARCEETLVVGEGDHEEQL